jgi:hypothetical protein
MYVVRGDSYIEYNATVTDNSGESIKANIVSSDVNTSELGEYHVVYHAADDAGNEANATRTVYVTEGHPPVITLYGDNPYEIEVGTSYNDPGVEATDQEDGNLPVDINDSAVDTNTVGTYYVYYSTTDSHGNTAEANRTVNVIEHIDLTAVYDEANATNLDSVTINVTENDLVPNGVSIDAVELIVRDWDDNATSYEQNITTYEGAWEVDGNNITFTPNSDFLGGDVSAEYRIVGSDGNTSSAWINIYYPIYMQANYDDVNTSEIDGMEPINIDVLANDILPEGEEITVGVDTGWENGERTYGSLHEDYEGNWTVESNKTVTFAPKESFNGGWVYTEYQIADTQGHHDTSGIQIEYPRYLYASYYWREMNETTSVSIDVTEESTIPSDETPTFGFITGYDDNGNRVVNSEYTDRDGRWTMEDNGTATFEPGDSFGGGNIRAEYQIMLNNGHHSENTIVLDYPVLFKAEYDDVDMNETVPVTIDVLANDTVIDGSTVTVEIETGWDRENDRETFGTQRETSDGNWSVDGEGNVIFEPNSDFNGGSVYIDYRITDDNGHESQAWISIDYPIYMRAYGDGRDMEVFEAVNIAVLDNDILPDGQEITVRLRTRDENGDIVYRDSHSDENGHWQVEANKTVTFTPVENWNGGWADIDYQIADEGNVTSESWISIGYPRYIQTEYDRLDKWVIEPTNVDVLANDTWPDDQSVTLKIVTARNGSGEETYGTQLASPEGNWTVENNNTITFSPSDTFEGGYINVRYQVTDENGHQAYEWLAIDYIVASPECNDSNVLDSVDAIDQSIADNIQAGFSQDDYRYYRSKIPRNKTISSDVWGGSDALGWFNPIGFIGYQQRDNFASMYLSSYDFGASDAWSKSRVSVQSNGDNNKYVDRSDENGTYTDDAHLRHINEWNADIKIVKVFSQTDMQTVFDNADINITVDGDDAASIVLYKGYGEYRWSDDGDDEYSTFNDFIAAKAYDSNETDAWRRILLYGNSGDKAITFEEGSSGTSGNLVEINSNYNRILTDAAGTWEIASFRDEDGSTYDILRIEPTLCGYNAVAYKIVDSKIVEGYKNKIEATHVYSESLLTKLKNYFIDIAPVDIDPDPDE